MGYKMKSDEDGNIYIHQSWESFKKHGKFESEAYGSAGAKSREKKILANYKKQASVIKKRNQTMMGSVDAKKGKEIISDIQQLYSNLDDIMNPNAIQEVKNMITTLKSDIKIDSLMWTAKTVGESAEKFDAALKKIEQAVKEYNNLDSTLVAYMEQGGEPLKGFKKIDDPSKLSMFSFDKKAQTSYTNLLRNLEIANSMVAFAEGKGPIESMEYTDSKGKVQTKSASSLIYGMRQRLINMLGGVGEIAGANVFNQAISNNLIKSLNEMSGVEVRLTGDEYKYSAALDKEVTRTGDFVIKYNKDGADVEMGFSVKAQMVKSLPKGKSVTTTYLTSPYDAILQRAGMLGSDIDYALANIMAHGKYGEAYGIRKLIASIVGIEAIAGRSNDPVVFLMYLDKITTSHEFLHSLSLGNISNALDLDFQKSNRAAIETSAKKQRETAYIRSTETRKILYKTLGQIQYEHKGK